MNANELMHNDLIMYGGDLCRFIIRATDARIIRLSDCGEFPPCAAVEAKPIKLTEEILNANGFENYEDLFWVTKNDTKIYIDTDGSNFEFSADSDSFLVRYLKVEFVHGLQQALRLCGLNELADNFKLEVE